MLAIPKSLRALFGSLGGRLGIYRPARHFPDTCGDKNTSKVCSDKFALPLDPKTYRMTSPMGPRCMPVVGGSTHRLGQDMGTTDNSPIAAVAQGTVRRIVKGTSPTSGQEILTHRIAGATCESASMHMRSNDVLVQEGQKVKPQLGADLLSRESGWVCDGYLRWGEATASRGSA